MFRQANPVVETERSQGAANVEVTNETDYYEEAVIRSDQSEREQEGRRSSDSIFVTYFRKRLNEGWSAFSGEEKSEALMFMVLFG